MKRHRSFLSGLFLFSGLTVIAVPDAQATLVLTAAGTADGFSLTTFATINPGNTGCCNGPFGLAVASNGTVLVEDAGLNKIMTFADTDGQTPATALHTINGNWGTVGATAVGNTFWSAAFGNNNFGGTFTTYSSDLSTITAQTVTGAGNAAVHPYLGMATTPDGHVIATSDAGQIVEITPGTSAVRVIANASGADGVSVSPDGTKVVVEVSGNVNVYDRTSGALLHSYATGNSPDGTGVISGGPLNGYIVVAGNDGTIDLINNAGVITTIATGGTRLDYTAPDSTTTNGSLLIDSSDLVYRLSCSGCSFATQPSTVPEPATSGLVAGGLVCAFLAYRRRMSKNS